MYISIVVNTIIIILLQVIKVYAFSIDFMPELVTLYMGETKTIYYEISGSIDGDSDLKIYSESEKVVSVSPEALHLDPIIGNGTFDINGKFLGRAAIRCKNNQGNILKSHVDVIVIREERLIDTIFTISVATLVSIVYINFGCALDWEELKSILRKPIGPAIGFCAQFIGMPLISFGLAHLLFPDTPTMQLGLFFVGVSPGGGASNLWTLLLDGNISLSIIMTALSTICAFFMMPLWIFTLGRTIFESGNLDIPYSQITTYIVALIVPLAVGYLIQKYLKSTAQFLIKIMKAFSLILLIFIVVFAIFTNWYLFELFSWKIIIAGMALPWLGFLIGFLSSTLLKQQSPDRTAISIEVGVQNTGIAIFLLRFALPQPEADLTTVVPVSIAMLTPFPLLLIYLYKKIRERLSSSYNLNISNVPMNKTGAVATT